VCGLSQLFNAAGDGRPESEGDCPLFEPVKYSNIHLQCSGARQYQGGDGQSEVTQNKDGRSWEVYWREGDMSKLTKCCVLLRFCPMDSNTACSLCDLRTYDSYRQ
jgi:hypothetical protein